MNPATPSGRRSVSLRDVFTNAKTQRRALDALVLVNGAKAEDELYHALRHRLPQLEVHMIGDCVAPRRINDAIHEGELIARRI